jgi:uncharacterized protein
MDRQRLYVSDILRGDAYDMFIDAALMLLDVCEENSVCPSHGLQHAMAVVRHTEKALQASGLLETMSNDEILAVLLAALLHDADDRKLFPKNPVGAYINTRRIMEAVNSALMARVLQLTKLVSTSENGNTIPEEAKEHPYVLYPRYADRLEALGEIGIWRCWQFTQTSKRPFFLETTPRAKSEADIKRIATPERFEQYQKTGKSDSMIDHFYDKLLHIGHLHSGNSYLELEAATRYQQMVNFVLEFGRTGTLPKIPTL